MKKRVISFILSITMLVSLMVACSPKEDPKPEEKPVVYDGLVINNDYVIVRGDLADKTTIKCAAPLREQINAAASLDINLKTDFYKKEEEIPEKEILVGKVKRNLEFDRSTLKEGEYYIGVEGSKVIIDAYDSETLYFAVKVFAEKWLTKDLGIHEDGTLLINEAMCGSMLGLDLEVKDSILILSQNMRSGNDGNGNDIEDRAPRFKQLMEEYQPDIVGTQETTKSWNDYFKSYFKGTYGMVGCSRNGRTATTGEWNTILYRLDRFELVDSDTFWLSNTPDKASKVESSSLNRICTWALLKDKQTGKTILMANTHLDHTSDQARNEQSVILLNQLRAMGNKYPLYITGDYNFEPSSEAYKIMNKAMLDAHDEALVDTSTTQYTFHSYGNPSKEIDFCFYNEKSLAVSYYIVNDDYNGFVSDHYGVLMKFVIN